MFVAMLKERLQDIYLQEWWAEIENSSSNRLYKHMKMSFGFEPYLIACSKLYRTNASKVRLSSHVFGVERGRWGKTRLQYEKRKCTLCNEIDDEYHCLLECPLYEKCRTDCLPITLSVRNKRSMHEFVKFVSSQNIDECLRLGTLCTRVMREYKMLM